MFLEEPTESDTNMAALGISLASPEVESNRSKTGTVDEGQVEPPNAPPAFDLNVKPAHGEDAPPGTSRSKTATVVDAGQVEPPKPPGTSRLFTATVVDAGQVEPPNSPPASDLNVNCAHREDAPPGTSTSALSTPKSGHGENSAAASSSQKKKIKRRTAAQLLEQETQVLDGKRSRTPSPKLKEAMASEAVSKAPPTGALKSHKRASTKSKAQRREARNLPQPLRPIIEEEETESDSDGGADKVPLSKLSKSAPKTAQNVKAKKSASKSTATTSAKRQRSETGEKAKVKKKRQELSQVKMLPHLLKGELHPRQHLLKGQVDPINPLLLVQVVGLPPPPGIDRFCVRQSVEVRAHFCARKHDCGKVIYFYHFIPSRC